MYFPFLGALSLASVTLLEKFLLKKKKINIKSFQVFTFLASVLVLASFVYFFWDVSSQAFETKNLIILSLVILFSVFANLLSFYSLKWEKVTSLEPARMLEPLFVILLAILFGLFIPHIYEKNYGVIIPAVIAGCALVFSHIEKHHLRFNKYFVAAVFGSLFFALELILTKMILGYYTPISFYFFRCVGILLISWIIFRPKFSELDKKNSPLILLTGALWVVYRIVVYYGYLKLGIIFTTLLIMLSPVLIYLFAWKFMNEKPSWRNLVAAAVIVGCVLYATLV